MSEEPSQNIESGSNCNVKVKPGTNRWNRGLSARRNRLLEQLNKIELGRQHLELAGHKSFFEDQQQTTNGNKSHDRFESNHEIKQNLKQDVDSNSSALLNHNLHSSNSSSSAHKEQHHGYDTSNMISNNNHGTDSIEHGLPDKVSVESEIKSGSILCSKEKATNIIIDSQITEQSSTKKREQKSDYFDLEHLERFICTRVPRNKRVLCLIVRDKQWAQVGSSKSKTQTSSVCYLFIQAIVDIEPSSNQNLIQTHIGNYNQNELDIDDELDMRINKDYGQQDGAKFNENENENENDAMSINSSLNTDLLFFEKSSTIRELERNETNSTPTLQTELKQLSLNGKDLNDSDNDIRNYKVADKDVDDDEDFDSDLNIQNNKNNGQCLTGRNSPIVHPKTSNNNYEHQDQDQDQDHHQHQHQHQQHDPDVPVKLASNVRYSGIAEKRQHETNRLFDNELSQYTGASLVVLSAKRRKNAKTYLIGLGERGHEGGGHQWKLKSNVLGTQFNAIRRNRADLGTITSINYETNVLGMKGPRKMKIYLAAKANDNDHDHQASSSQVSNLIEAYKRTPANVIQLRNTTPVWNVETQSYVLNFHGRVTQPSVKNFQLIQYHQHRHQHHSEQRQNASNKESQRDHNHQSSGSDQLNDLKQSSSSLLLDPISQQEQQQHHHQQLAAIPIEPVSPTSDFESQSQSQSQSQTQSQSSSHRIRNTDLSYDSSIVMQFGRTSSNEFSCDVTHPLSILQAFCIALSSLDSKLACE